MIRSHRFSSHITVPDKLIRDTVEDLALLIGRESAMDKYIADALREHSDGLEEFMVRVYARVYMGQKRCCDPDSSNFGPEAPPEMEILEVVFKGTTVEVPDKYTTDDVYERLEEDGWESLD